MAVSVSQRIRVPGITHFQRALLPSSSPLPPQSSSACELESNFSELCPPGVTDEVVSDSPLALDGLVSGHEVMSAAVSQEICWDENGMTFKC